MQSNAYRQEEHLLNIGATRCAKATIPRHRSASRPMLHNYSQFRDGQIPELNITQIWTQ